MSQRVKMLWVIVLSAAAGLLTYHYLSLSRDTIAVVVANQSIPARTVIAANMLGVVQVSRADANMYQDAFHSPDEAVGKVAVQEIASGWVIHNNPNVLIRAANVGATPATGASNTLGIAAFIPADMRAVTVTVDGQGALNHQLHPGDRVDVIFTPRTAGPGSGEPGRILSGIQVFNMDKAGSGGLTDAGSDQVNVTLIVSRDDAVTLNVYKRRGFIDLALNPTQPDKQQPTSTAAKH